MGTERVAEPPSVAESPVISALLDQYASRPVHFAGKAASPYKPASTIDRDPVRCARPAQDCVFARVLRFTGRSDGLGQAMIATRSRPPVTKRVTSNMKFIMNGFLFGLTRDQVAGTRSWYNPRWHYDNESETRAAKSYLQAQDRLGDLDTNQDAWAPKALLNLPSSGKSSSDRSIAEYAADIWGISPCPVQ